MGRKVWREMAPWLGKTTERRMRRPWLLAFDAVCMPGKWRNECVGPVVRRDGDAPRPLRTRHATGRCGA